jgi:hypothetical protein
MRRCPLAAHNNLRSLVLITCGPGLDGLPPNLRKLEYRQDHSEEEDNFDIVRAACALTLLDKLIIQVDKTR